MTLGVMMAVSMMIAMKKRKGEHMPLRRCSNALRHAEIHTHVCTKRNLNSCAQCSTPVHSLASTFAKEEDLLHFEDSRHRPHHHRDDEEEEEEEEYDLIEAMSLARIALESRGETQTQERPEKLTVLRFWLEAFGSSACSRVCG